MPKEERRKPQYGMFSSAKWLFTKMWNWDKSIAFTSVLLVPLSVILYAFGLYIPPIVLDSLQKSETFTEVAIVIVGLLGGQLIFDLARNCVSTVRLQGLQKNSNRLYYELFQKNSDLDYYLHYDENANKIRRRAWEVLGDHAAGTLSGFIYDFADLIVNIFCFFLFGSIISMLSPWVILLLMIGSVTDLLMQRWKQNRDYQEQDERTANDQKIGYMTWVLPARADFGKDVRTYPYTDFFMEKAEVLIQEKTKYHTHMWQSQTVVSFVSFAMTALRNAVAYAFLIVGAVAGKIDAAQFVLYFSAISQMSGFIGGILRYFGNVHSSSLKISDARAYLDDLQGNLNHGKGIPLPKGRPLTIEFRNVTFRYPDTEKNVLENVSFKIEAGEKIALVGLNGAGKTTVTLLMCGLFLPSEGEVLIDGHSTLEYNRDELYTLFSMVPQDYFIMPTTVAENISLCDSSEIDYDKLWKCLETAGIADQIRRLKNGPDTQMNKTYDVDAVHFSGGEMQRLLLARALYRKAPILILDEPTAALDPIAEDRMYHKYNEIAENTTSVFISHRLASTRFCDQIYFLEGAALAECGTHEELMAKGGRYRELFDVQSKYYQEGVKSDEIKE